MKKLLILGLIILTSLKSFCQNENQVFCADFETDEYFPIDINKKKLLWGPTYYFEEIVGKKIINGKVYIEYSQTWEAGNVETLFLRNENGIVFQYEDCCENETIRFNDNLNKGDTWFSADKKSKYTIISFEGNLETPFCNYEDLLIIEGEFVDQTFQFYYKKGYGYVGASLEGEVISIATPEW